MYILIKQKLLMLPENTVIKLFMFCDSRQDSPNIKSRGANAFFEKGVGDDNDSSSSSTSSKNKPRYGKCPEMFYNENIQLPYMFKLNVQCILMIIK